MAGEAIVRRACAAVAQADHVLRHQNRLAHKIIREASWLLIAGENYIPINTMKKIFTDYVNERRPINPDTGQPHTYDTAIRHWPSAIIPFFQDTFPGVPFERIRFSPHTRGLDEISNVDDRVMAMIALHTYEKYGTDTFIRRYRSGELAAQAKTMSQDMQRQFAKGNGIRADGTFGPMPSPLQPQTPTLQPQTPQGEIHRRIMEMGQHPYETTPQRD